jgi:hypothetical protein
LDKLCSSQVALECIQILFTTNLSTPLQVFNYLPQNIPYNTENSNNILSSRTLLNLHHEKISLFQTFCLLRLHLRKPAYSGKIYVPYPARKTPLPIRELPSTWGQIKLSSQFSVALACLVQDSHVVKKESGEVWSCTR